MTGPLLTDSDREALYVAWGLASTDGLCETVETIARRIAADALDEAADDIAENIDWSPGRYDYGDNAGYADAAQILRKRAQEVRDD